MRGKVHKNMKKIFFSNCNFKTQAEDEVIQRGEKKGLRRDHIKRNKGLLK